MTVVYLPLQGRLAGNRDLITADNYESIVNEFLTPADAIYTFVFRYARMNDRDLRTHFGEKVSTQGAPFDFTNSNPWAAWLTTAFVICACAAWAVAEYTSIKEKAKKEEDEINNSYETIRAKLFRKQEEKAFSEKKEMDDKYFANEAEKRRRQLLMDVAPPPSTQEINRYLADILAENPELTKQYNSVTVNDGEPPQLVFDKKEIKRTTLQKSVDRFFSPVWSALGITVFVYWIAYAASGVFSDFGNYGASVLPGFGFGASLLSGLVYLGLYGYGAYKQYKQQQSGEPALADVNDAKNGIYLLQEYQKRREYDLTKRALETNLGLTHLPATKKSYEHLIKPEPKPATRKGLLVATWLGSFVGSFIAMQYISWLAVDMAFRTASVALPAIQLVNLIGGICAFAVAGIYSIYKTHQSYKNGNAKEISAPIEPQQSAEEIYEQRKKDIALLKQQLIGQSYEREDGKTVVIDEKYLTITNPHTITIQPKYVPAPKNIPWETTKRILKAIFKFACNFMTGAMLARCFLIKGTATFLPFAALALSNPWTLGLVFGIATVWGLFQIYKEYQQCKAEEEHQAKLEADKKNTEYVHAIQLADLDISALKKLNAKVNSNAHESKHAADEKQEVKQSPLRVVARNPNDFHYHPQSKLGLFDESLSSSGKEQKEPLFNSERVPLIAAQA